MPTAKRRLSLTLEPVLSAQLERLSALTGNSQGKIITEILDGSVDVFARLITMLEAAQAATEEAKGKVGRDMKSAQLRLERQLGLMLDDLGETTAPLLADQEVVKRRRRKAALACDALDSGAGASSTPISNRGVRSIKSKGNPVQKGVI